MNDPTIDDPYAVFVHGFNTVGGATANGVFFDWTVVGANGEPDGDPASVERALRQTATVNVNWTGLPPDLARSGRRRLAQRSDAGIQGLTYVSVENDEGAGYCDLVT